MVLNCEDLYFGMSHHYCWEHLSDAVSLDLEVAYHQKKSDPHLRRNKIDCHVRDHPSPRHRLPLLLGCAFEEVIGPPRQLSAMGAQC